MEYSEMATTLRKLEINYNKKNMLKEQKDDWYEMFKDCDYIYFARAIKYITKNNRYFPNVKEIYEALDKVIDTPLTEREKTYKMKKKNIIPKWLGKNIEQKPLTQEELEELDKLLQSVSKGKGVKYGK